MERTLKEALRHRRSYYSLSAKSPITDEQIADLVRFAATYIPSAFNSKSTRLVLLLHKEHARLWNLVKETLKAIVSPEAFVNTEKKIDGSFASGYGTILFFEDQSVVETLQKDFPSYSNHFPTWSQHTSAMHQLTLWTLLEDVGFGASLQHYNPLIDQKVRELWGLPDSWSLVSQMPFGIPTQEPAPKPEESLGDRVRIFGENK